MKIERGRLYVAGYTGGPPAGSGEPLTGAVPALECDASMAAVRRSAPPGAKLWLVLADEDTEISTPASYPGGQLWWICPVAEKKGVSGLVIGVVGAVGLCAWYLLSRKG